MRDDLGGMESGISRTMDLLATERRSSEIAGCSPMIPRCSLSFWFLGGVLRHDTMVWKRGRIPARYARQFCEFYGPDLGTGLWMKR